MGQYNSLWLSLILAGQVIYTAVYGLNITLEANGTTQTFHFNQSSYSEGESGGRSYIQIRAVDPVGYFVLIGVNTTANLTQQVCKDGNIRLYSGDNPTTELYLGPFCGSPTVFTSSQNALTVVISDATSILADNILTLKYSQVHNIACDSLTTYSATFTPRYIRTPGYPLGTHNVTGCSWRIVGPSSNRLFLTFKYADASVTPNCSVTNITVHTIIGTESKIQTWCGEGERTFAIYKQSFSFVVSSGLEHVNTGMQMEYVAEEENRCEHRIRISNESIGEIMSPGFPTGYKDLQECKWFISSKASDKLYIQLKVLESNLDDTEGCSKDIVQMYNPADSKRQIIGSWCGGDKSTFQFFLAALTVVYRTGTDHSRNFTGFKLRYEIVEDGMCNQQLTASSMPQTLKSDNYPNPFPSYKKCKYVIKASARNAISIFVNASDVGGSNHCIDKVVAVYDGQEEKSQNRIGGWCKTTTPSYQSLSRQMLIVFKADDSANKTGFLLQYWEGQVNMAIEAYGYEKSIVFPHEEGDYLSGYDTWWNITSSRSGHMVVWFTQVDVRCPEDNITLHDGGVGPGYRTWSFCGKDDRSFMTTTEQLFINFQTRTNLGKGFKFSYQWQFYRDCGVSVSQLTAHDSTASIYSPGYSNQYYDQLNCKWLLVGLLPEHRIKLIVNVVNISKSENCVQDYLAVYDGSSAKSNQVSNICGANINRTIRSTGNKLYIEFVTDDRSSGYGFNLVYSAEKHQEEESSPNPVIIGVIVVLVILAIAIIIGLCYWMRKKSRDTNLQSQAEMNSLNGPPPYDAASDPKTLYANDSARDLPS
ncbi:cubilin-like [Haliotis cracherodii]|uniref:cubilin-like n=1 Tax=Haliotis cracherodii TaxID=6455 RepID=UPI0039EB827C